MPDTESDIDLDPDIDPDPDPATDAGAGDRAREGFEHLQAAARELIQAARAMLDVAEDLVNDPETVASVAGTVGTLGDLVRHRAAGQARRRPDAADPEPAPDARGPDDPTVERITVL